MKTNEIYYDEEGDILEATWQTAQKRPQTGIEINDNIVIFTDSAITVLLGLMLISYRPLSALSCIELSKLPLLPPEKQERVRLLLQQEPLNRFLQFDGANSVKVIKQSQMNVIFPLAP